jgi:hypothetical protein
MLTGARPSGPRGGPADRCGTGRAGTVTREHEPGCQKRWTASFARRCPLPSDRYADAGEFAFFLHYTTELTDDERRFTLTPEDIALLKPNTLTCPIFRIRRVAELTRTLFRRVPVLLAENGGDGTLLDIRFTSMFHMSNDSKRFYLRDQLSSTAELRGNRYVRGHEVWLPLYEAKMMSRFDHRAADVVISVIATIHQRASR